MKRSMKVLIALAIATILVIGSVSAVAASQPPWGREGDVYIWEGGSNVHANAYSQAAEYEDYIYVKAKLWNDEGTNDSASDSEILYDYVITGVSIAWDDADWDAKGTHTFRTEGYDNLTFYTYDDLTTY